MAWDAAEAGESRDCQCQSLPRQPTQRQVLTTSNINSYSLLVTLVVSIVSAPVL